MYKDKEKAKEAARERQKKHRQGVTLGVTNKGVTGQGVTRIDVIKQAPGEGLVKDIEKLGGSEARYERACQYQQRKTPAIVHAIVYDRDRLDGVYRSLRDAHQEKNVHYGHPYNGTSFDIIGEMLEVTR